MADIHSEYKIEGSLGKGGFGSVSLGIHRRTGKRWAVKAIPKVSTSKAEFETEVSALADLDHPHIIKLVEWFEDDENYHLVTELCTGEDLVDFLDGKDDDPVSEKEVSIIMRQCLKSVLGCHASGFVHRDIKLDNFMTTGEDKTVKMIDFGLATRYRSNNILTERVGTLDYWPPEMVVGKLKGYSPLFDVWSLGVVMYALLTVELLFPATDEKQLGEACQVLQEGTWCPGTLVAKNADGTYAVDLEGGLAKTKSQRRRQAKMATYRWLGHVKSDMIRMDHRAQVAGLLQNSHCIQQRLEKSSRLRKASASARDLLSHMLSQDPEHRISAADALSHPFILKHCHDGLQQSKHVVKTCHDGSFDPRKDISFVDKMRRFTQAPTLKKLALVIMTHLVSETDSRDELLVMRHMFRTVNVNGDGDITLEELTRYLTQHGTEIPDDLATLYDACDAYGNGTLNFGEFSAAIFPMALIDAKLCLETFRVFDRERNFQIGAQDLKSLFKSQKHTLAECQEIINDAERTIRGPGEEMKGILDFDDFRRFMCGQSSMHSGAAMTHKLHSVPSCAAAQPALPQSVTNGT